LKTSKETQIVSTVAMAVINGSFTSYKW